MPITCTSPAAAALAAAVTRSGQSAAGAPPRDRPVSIFRCSRAGWPASRAAAAISVTVQGALADRSTSAATPAARSLPGAASQDSTGVVIPALRSASASSRNATPSQLAPPASAARADGSRPCPYPSALTTAITSAGVRDRSSATLSRIASRSTTASDRTMAPILPEGPVAPAAPCAVAVGPPILSSVPVSDFTDSGIERLHRVLARHVDGGAVPGLVALVDRGGRTEVVCLGERSIGGPPVTRATIFRISSMSKPITAVAALMLVEECVLRLDDPVDDLLPELADRRVLTRLDAPLYDTVPAERSITVRDLLTSTMGFGQVMADPADVPVVAAANERAIGMGPPDPGAGRVAAAARRAAADVPAGPALGLPRADGGARGADRAGDRDAAVAVPGRAGVRAAGDGRHRVQRPGRVARPVRHLVPARPGDRRAVRVRPGRRGLEPAAGVRVGWRRARLDCRRPARV